MPKMAQPDFPNGKLGLFPWWSLWSGCVGGGGGSGGTPPPPAVYGHSNTSLGGGGGTRGGGEGGGIPKEISNSGLAAGWAPHIAPTGGATTRTTESGTFGDAHVGSPSPTNRLPRTPPAPRRHLPLGATCPSPLSSRRYCLPPSPARPWPCPAAMPAPWATGWAASLPVPPPRPCASVQPGKSTTGSTCTLA